MMIGVLIKDGFREKLDSIFLFMYNGLAWRNKPIEAYSYYKRLYQ